MKLEWSAMALADLDRFATFLHDVVGDMLPQELFWVIKNGIKMTGMPSFGKIEVPDPEIWSMVAFLKKLPVVTEVDYKAWTAAAPAKP